jgi:hypothetical protein
MVKSRAEEVGFDRRPSERRFIVYRKGKVDLFALKAAKRLPIQKTGYVAQEIGYGYPDTRGTSAFPYPA